MSDALKIIGIVVAVLAGLAVISMAGTLIGAASGLFNNGVKTVTKEISPSELLRKYSWFKDVAAQLDAKRAEISIFEANAKKHPTELADMELAGMKSSYNDLAAQYNSQMAKMNWRFTNVGDLPAGATQPLEREVAPYTYQ